MRSLLCLHTAAESTSAQPCCLAASRQQSATGSNALLISGRDLLLPPPTLHAVRGTQSGFNVCFWLSQPLGAGPHLGLQRSLRLRAAVDELLHCADHFWRRLESQHVLHGLHDLCCGQRQPRFGGLFIFVPVLPASRPTPSIARRYASMRACRHPSACMTLLAAWHRAVLSRCTGEAAKASPEVQDGSCCVPGRWLGRAALGAHPSGRTASRMRTCTAK